MPHPPACTPVFISPYKCGTSSVGTALSSMGYTDAGWTPNSFSTQEYDLIADFNAKVKQYEFLSEIPEELCDSIKTELTPCMTRVLGKHTCSSDWPMGHECIHPFIRKIVFPTCKFVYLLRDRESYIKSAETHHLKMNNTEKFNDMNATFVESKLHNNFKVELEKIWDIHQEFIQIYTRLKQEHPDDVLFMNLFETSDYAKWTQLCALVNIRARPYATKRFPWIK